ncbi:MAG: aminodeoxychorismate synthase component I [Sedimentisphaerales bacterium]|nr:aminodeoxychorismate synthase component I [Sedimentisphaerales bacterium]
MAAPSSALFQMANRRRDNRWLAFSDPVQVHQSRNPAAVPALLEQVEQQVEDEGLYALGFLTYEAAGGFNPALRTRLPRPPRPPGNLPVAYFGLYRRLRCCRIEPVPLAIRYDPASWRTRLERGAYDRALDRIREYLLDGHSYQVNYTFRLESTWSGDPWSHFVRLWQHQPHGYAAYLAADDFVIGSVSPELFFRRRADKLTCRPMKGSAGRSLSVDQDRRQAEALRRSEKNRAENAMIVDMIRNDLGRIARAGTVRAESLYDLESHPTIHQMTSTVTARTEADLAGVFGALFPCASITGAPKVRTMEIIHELEPDPRGVYTGCIGYLAPRRRACFNVAIRTVTWDRLTHTAAYGVGGGITVDSDTDGEYQECLWKAEVLHRSLADG